MKYSLRLLPGFAVAALAAVQALFAGTTEPLPVEVEKIAPVNIVEKAPGHLFVDFGRVAFGNLEIKVPQVQTGQKLTVSMGEALCEPLTVNPKPPGSVRFVRAEIPLVEGQVTYLVPLPVRDQRNMPTQIGAAMPFRYVEITGAPAGFGKEALTQLSVHYPFNDRAAQFKSSDDTLNSIWELCHYTIKATSFCGVFVDGDRERKPYEGDAYINQLGWFACTPDTTLPRHTWQYLIEHPTWPTEYILLSPILAWDEYRYSGDPAGLKAYYTQLKARTLLSLQRPDGLLKTSVVQVPQELASAIPIPKFGDLIDWPMGERDGYEMRPVNTVVNAFHVLALRNMAEIARALNKKDDVALFETAARKTLDAFNTTLVDPATGLYLDAEGSHHSSLHANMIPLAFGLVPAERKAKVEEFVNSRDMACSVYMSQFFLDALFDTGHAERAIALMTAEGDRSWKHMLDQGTTLTYEAWDQKYKPNQDWNHAWGTAPANLIPRKVMGIEPLEPGFAKVLIAPKPGSLKWAEIKVPTVRGSLSVRFENCIEFQIEVTIPAKSTARIALPAVAEDGPVNVLVDGKLVKATAKDKVVLFDGIGSGKHTFTLKR